jgi:hypothetical protein
LVHTTARIGQPEQFFTRVYLVTLRTPWICVCVCVCVCVYIYMPVPLAALSEARTVFDDSNTGIMGSNPTRGMDMFPHFSVLRCPV